MIIVLLVVLALCFGGVLLVGAPYVPTLSPQVQAALDLAKLRPGEHLLELGCGDGRVLVAAAQRGIRVTGYELNPFLALVAWLRTRRYRHLVRVVWGDFWRADWPAADAVFVFLLDRFMSKLDERLQAYPHRPIRLVSFAFRIPAKRPAAERAGVYLYRYQ